MNANKTISFRKSIPALIILNNKHDDVVSK